VQDLGWKQKTVRLQLKTQQKTKMNVEKTDKC